MSPSVLILVDGTAVLYRSFFAIKNLSTRDGRPTNAVFGFVRLMGQILRARKPTHWFVALDGGLPEERLELLEEYKAQRPRMPDDLREQSVTIERYLDLAGIPWLRKQGEEADDVLASLVEQCRPRASRIYIATSDKDLFQLVDEQVRILPLGGKTGVLDCEGVRGKTGVAPVHIPEWLALVGDSSDNIPGVPGVGAKTAAALLNEYGSLDGLWERMDEIRSERTRTALREHRDVVLRNIEIVTLKKGLDTGTSWEQMEVREPDPAKLVPFFEELEFHSLAQELREQPLL